MADYITYSIQKTSLFQNKINIAKLKFLLLCVVLVLLNFNGLARTLQSVKKTNSVPMMRLMMSGAPNYLDETVVYYQIGATDGFDTEYDAYKLLGPNSAPHISQEYNSTLLAINGINPVSSTFSINIKTTTNITGSYTITAADFAFLPIGTCVYLNDLVTGSTVNILAGPYVFNLLNSTTSSRFVLTITHFELAMTSNIIQPTCQTSNSNKFKVTGLSNGPWNYVWKDSLGVVIQNTTSSFDSDSLVNIVSGNYDIEITSSSNSCYSNSSHFFINEIIVPTIYFSSPDTIIASVSQNFNTSNQSINCNLFNWNFGDGIGTSSDFEPTYNYSVAGIYKTTLIGISSTGCMDSISKYINVVDFATSLKKDIRQNIKLLSAGNNSYIINFDNYIINEIGIDLYDMKGQSVFAEHRNNLKENTKVFLDYNEINSGIYILNISHKNIKLLSTKIIIQ